jgi:hypothetical protein
MFYRFPVRTVVVDSVGGTGGVRDLQASLVVPVSTVGVTATGESSRPHWQAERWRLRRLQRPAFTKTKATGRRERLWSSVLHALLGSRRQRRDGGDDDRAGRGVCRLPPGPAEARPRRRGSARHGVCRRRRFDAAPVPDGAISGPRGKPGVERDHVPGRPRRLPVLPRQWRAGCPLLSRPDPLSECASRGLVVRRDLHGSESPSGPRPLRALVPRDPPRLVDRPGSAVRGILRMRRAPPWAAVQICRYTRSPTG